MITSLPSSILGGSVAGLGKYVMSDSVEGFAGKCEKSKKYKLGDQYLVWKSDGAKKDDSPH